VGTTPTLSPTSGYSSNSHSPPFPRSPESNTFTSRSPSPAVRQPFLERHRNNASPLNPIITNVAVPVKEKALPSPASSGSEYTPSPSPGALIGRQDQDQPRSPTSGSEYGGLAYAESEDAHSPIRQVKILAIEKSLPVVPPPPARQAREAVKKALSPEDKQRSSLPVSPDVGWKRRQSSISASSHSHATALDRTMNALFHDDAASNASSSPRSVMGRGLPKAPDETRSPKMPARSKTTHTGSSPVVAATPLRGTKTLRESSRDRTVDVKRERVCVRCEKRVHDGRWVQVEAGKVLCEGCWKNMYLPKVSRPQWTGAYSD
jgi:hypothetical protein